MLVLRKEDGHTPTQLPRHSSGGDESEVSSLYWKIHGGVLLTTTSVNGCIFVPDKALGGCGYAALGCMWSERSSLDVLT